MSFLLDPPMLVASGVHGHPMDRFAGLYRAGGATIAWGDHRSRYIKATATPLGMGSMVLPGYGPDLVRRLGDVDHVGVFGAMIVDEPSGRVLGRRLGSPVLRYDLSRPDTDWYLAIADEIVACNR